MDVLSILINIPFIMIPSIFICLLGICLTILIYD
jgi:hypothetical protein